jgi:hypothetical protein
MISPDPETSAEGGAPADRRNFLSRSAIMIALLALAGGEGVADAAQVDFKGPVTLTQSEVPSLNMVLNNAIKAGKVDSASPSFLKLSKGIQGSLLSLTSADLGTLRAAQGIIAGHLQLPNASDNSGNIGM